MARISRRTQDANAGLVARSFEVGIQNGQACWGVGPDLGVGAVAVGANRVDCARKQLRRIREHPDRASGLQCVGNERARTDFVGKATLFERICANDQRVRVRREHMQRCVGCEARADAFSATQDLVDCFSALQARTPFGTNHLPNSRAGRKYGLKNRRAVGIRRDDLLVATAQGGTEMLSDASRGDT
jgi:hypothetical protein